MQLIRHPIIVVSVFAVAVVGLAIALRLPLTRMPQSRPLPTGIPPSRLTSVCEQALTEIALSPDGQEIATYSADGILRLFDVSSLTERIAFKEGLNVWTRLRYDPSGALLAWTDTTGTVLLDRATHSRRRLEYAGIPSVLAFDHTGNQLVVTGYDGQRADVWQLGQMDVRVAVISFPESTRAAVVLPGDSTIGAIAGMHNELFRIPLAPGSASPIAADPGDYLAFSDDGRHVLEKQVIQNAVDLEVHSAIDGSLIDSLRISEMLPQIAAFSPVQDYVVLLDRSRNSDKRGKIGVWTIGKPNQFVCVSIDYDPYCIAFIPNGTTFVVGCGDGTMCMWDVRQLAEGKKTSGGERP